MSTRLPTTTRWELHCHSVFSPDGYGTPEQVVELAATRGASLLSITDHNHFGAHKRAAARASDLGLPYISGIEIDAEEESTGKSLHFVCYGCDVDNEQLNQLVGRSTTRYVIAADGMLEFLPELGIPVTREEVEAGLAERYPTNAGAALNPWYLRIWLAQNGRIEDSAHYNRLAREVGRLRDARRAAGLLAPKPPAVAFQETCETVHAAGGIILLAHGARYFPGKMDAHIALIQSLMERGLDGFELYHPANTVEPELARLEDLARQTNCFISAGSDCHTVPTEPENGIFARTPVPEWMVERWEGLWERRKAGQN